MAKMMINGCNLFYEEHGTGDQAVILLHDLFFSHRMLNQQMIALRDRFRCILVDLRGHGSSVVTSGGYSMETMAHDIWQLIEVSRYGPCHFIGAGMGGYLSLMCALGRPHLASSLSILGTAGDVSTEQDIKKLKAISLRSKVFGLRMCQPAISKRAFSSAYLKNSAYKSQKTHWKSEFLKLDRREITHSIAAYIKRPRLSDSLYKLQMPTLIVGAENDAVTPTASIKSLHNSIKGAKLKILADSGHSINLEKAPEVTTAIQEFL